MKSNPTTPLNKKIILHLDVEGVITLPGDNKQLLVYQLCAEWMWGRFQKDSKEDAQKITGWKMTANTLSIEQPQPDLITYKQYLVTYVNKQQHEKLLFNIIKGPGSKVKAEIQKNIKNITLPKTLFQAIKQSAAPEYSFIRSYLKDGKYVILPGFFKLLMSLKKNKRQFAIVVKGNRVKYDHRSIIQQLNMFFKGQHPLFNGKNGTPQVRFDGSKGVKNLIIQQSHETVVYEFNEGQFFSSYGTTQQQEQKDFQMFKQKFKSMKHVRLTVGAPQIYAYGHTILTQSACIYEVNPHRVLFIDPVDTLTQEIYFTSHKTPHIFNCVGDPILDHKHIVVTVNSFELLRDVDYFVKQVEIIDGGKVGENQKGERTKEEKEQVEQKLDDKAYLKKHLLPVLEGALKQVDLFRPQDPLAFIALYCLKNKHRLQ